MRHNAKNRKSLSGPFYLSKSSSFICISGAQQPILMSDWKILERLPPNELASSFVSFRGLVQTFLRLFILISFAIGFNLAAGKIDDAIRPDKELFNFLNLTFVLVLFSVFA